MKVGDTKVDRRHQKITAKTDIKPGIGIKASQKLADNLTGTSKKALYVSDDDFQVQLNKLLRGPGTRTERVTTLQVDSENQGNVDSRTDFERATTNQTGFHKFNSSSEQETGPKHNKSTKKIVFIC